MSLNSMPIPDQLTKTSIQNLLTFNVAQLMNLAVAVQNAYYVEMREADGLRSALDSTFDLTRFEYELLHFFDSRPQLGDVLDEATVSFNTTRRLGGSCNYMTCRREEVQLPDDMSRETLDTYADYFRHLNRVIDNISEELHNMRLVKLYRVVAVTPRMRDHEHHFPAYIAEMIRVMKDAGLRLEFEAPYLQPDEMIPEIVPRDNPNRRSIKAEECFFPFVLDAFKAWDKAHLEPARKRFEILPQRFVDVMMGWHELASVSHKMTLNEYCRTCVVFFNIQGFLHAGSRVLSKENVQKPLHDVSDIMIESLALIVQPKPKSPFKEDIVKIMRGRLDRWRKDIRATEIDFKTRCRIISKLRNYATQYEFIMAQMREDCYDYEECYCSSKALFECYSREDRYLECSTAEVPGLSRNLIIILDYFKKSIAMSPKELSADKYVPNLYRELPIESLSPPEEISKELKLGTHSSKLKSGGDSLQMIFSLGKYVISREPDSNRQLPEYGSDRSYFTKSIDSAQSCKVSSVNGSRQTLAISISRTSKCDAQSVYMRSQTENHSLLPESSEGSRDKYSRTEGASGHIPQLHSLMCNNESAQATNSCIAVSSRASKENASSGASKPTVPSQPILCKDIDEKICCQSTDFCTGGQLASEFSRICQITDPPALNMPQSYGFPVNDSDINATLLTEKPKGNDVQTSYPQTRRSSKKLCSWQKNPCRAEIKGLNKDAIQGVSHQNATLNTKLVKQSADSRTVSCSTSKVATVGENSASGITKPSGDRAEIRSPVELPTSHLEGQTISNKDVTEIRSLLGVEGATAVQSSAAGSTESILGENACVRCESEPVSEHEEMSSADEESFVVISENDIRSLFDTDLTEEEYLVIQSARNAEHSMCSVM